MRNGISERAQSLPKPGVVERLGRHSFLPQFVATVIPKRMNLLRLRDTKVTQRTGNRKKKYM